ncbi:MAG: hypothetical protein JOY64_32385, partial [Alphaproteobacteria bacterium]|nr:hypothetical protein [Alphaproteobacteria bacterium]
MPDLPASGVFQVRDYSGMGGMHWRPPFESIEFGANGACTMKSTTGSCTGTLKSIAAGKFAGSYDLDGKNGQFEVEPKADGTLQLEFFNVGFRSYGNTRSDGGVIVRAAKGAATVHGGGPSVRDKKRFFPGVLSNRTFQADGVLFGEEEGIGRKCKWVVIDPNRHKLRIWEKPSPTHYFTTAGQALGASVFSNGPLVHARIEGGKAKLAVTYYGTGITKDLGARIFMGFAGRKAMMFDDRYG